MRILILMLFLTSCTLPQHWKRTPAPQPEEQAQEITAEPEPESQPKKKPEKPQTGIAANPLAACQEKPTADEKKQLLQKLDCLIEIRKQKR